MLQALIGFLQHPTGPGRCLASESPSRRRGHWARAQRRTHFRRALEKSIPDCTDPRVRFADNFTRFGGITVLFFAPRSLLSARTPRCDKQNELTTEGTEYLARGERQPRG